MEALFLHKTIRKFKDTPIPNEVIQQILLAAIRASNTGNMQLYSIIVTTDATIKQQLCEQAHFNQAMVKQAPVILTFCADLHRFTQWCTLRNAEPYYDNFLSFYTATIDAVIAAQNACIAAESIGLGICYLGTTNYNTQQIIDILQLPKLVVPVTTVVIGYPDEQPPLTHRLPVEAVIHNQTYTCPNNTTIEQWYAEKENLEESKKFVAENNLDNLAQVFTKKRYTAQNNTVFSQKLLDILNKQHCMNNQ
ncbi:MAG TPA: nitroreductase family protein [Bacteroidales bacterium]|jgi:nitroreductase|nr:nitroreductase family protein [Bacteroidales bacterium]